MKLLPFKTYLAVIKNSAGSRAFRNFYAEISGQRKDLLKDGQLSCAFFASTVLRQFDLIKEPHLTVDGTVKDMLESGWREASRPRVGCVLVWEGKLFKSGEMHKHIGFYIGKNRAVSNDWRNGKIAEHDWTYHGKRKVSMILEPISKIDFIKPPCPPRLFSAASQDFLLKRP